jgi:hypothetical protein
MMLFGDLPALAAGLTWRKLELNTEFYKHVHIQRVMGAREILSTTFGASPDFSKVHRERCLTRSTAID